MLCPSCQTSNDADAVFCKHCGTSMTSSAAPASEGYSLILNDPGHNKINVIKLIREVMNSSLLDAKNLAEMQGGALHHGLSEEVANELASKLRAAGADVTVTPTAPGDQGPFRVNPSKKVTVTFNTSFNTKKIDPLAPSDPFNSPNAGQSKPGMGRTIFALILMLLAAIGYFVYVSSLHPK